LPKPMQVTVCPGNYLLGIDHKQGLRRLAGDEKLPGYSPVRDNRFNPINVMFFFHGMGHAANPYPEAASNLLDHWNVLLL